MNIPVAEIDGWINAFLFIQMLRLRHHYEVSVQQGAIDTQGLNNLIDPALLNELDRRILKEAFRQARKVQTRLVLNYQL